MGKSSTLRINTQPFVEPDARERAPAGLVAAEGIEMTGDRPPLDLLKTIFGGLRLEDSDSGYQRLVEILCTNFGIKISAKELRILARQIPVNPLIEAMERWPWKYAADEECTRFYQAIRAAAAQAGLTVQAEVQGESFKC